MDATIPAGSAAPARPQAPLAPGVLPLVAATLAMTACLFLAQAVVLGVETLAGPLSRPGRLGLTTALLAVGVGLLAWSQSSYVRARRALAADPSLRGRWVVENAGWWVVAIPLLVLACGLAWVAWRVASWA